VIAHATTADAKIISHINAIPMHPKTIVNIAQTPFCYLLRSAEYVTIQHSAENRHMTTIAIFAINIVVSLICLPRQATTRLAQPLPACLPRHTPPRRATSRLALPAQPRRAAPNQAAPSLACLDSPRLAMPLHASPCLPNQAVPSL